jgi:hypothetical protein
MLECVTGLSVGATLERRVECWITLVTGCSAVQCCTTTTGVVVVPKGAGKWAKSSEVGLEERKEAERLHHKALALIKRTAFSKYGKKAAGFSDIGKCPSPFMTSKFTRFAVFPALISSNVLRLISGVQL